MLWGSLVGQQGQLDNTSAYVAVLHLCGSIPNCSSACLFAYMHHALWRGVADRRLSLHHMHLDFAMELACDIKHTCISAWFVGYCCLTDNTPPWNSPVARTTPIFLRLMCVCLPMVWALDEPARTSVTSGMPQPALAAFVSMVGLHGPRKQLLR